MAFFNHSGLYADRFWGFHVLIFWLLVDPKSIGSLK